MTISRLIQLSFLPVFLLVFLVLPARCIEITPFAGYRIGGSLEDDLTGVEMDLADAENYGVVVNFDLSPGKQIEFLYSHQETKVQVSPTFIISPDWQIDVDYLHFGGITVYNNHSHFRPFVAGGIGLTRMDPERFDPESKLSLSLAAGGKLFFSENAGLRLEARSYWTFFDNNSAIFCNNSGCRILVEGDAWWQFETNVGLFLHF